MEWQMWLINHNGLVDLHTPIHPPPLGKQLLYLLLAWGHFLLNCLKTHSRQDVNMFKSCLEALPGRGSHVTRLNFKTSCVGVYKCLSIIVGLPSLSQFGLGRLSLVAISFYSLSLLFGPCRLSGFTLVGPLFIS